MKFTALAGYADDADVRTFHWINDHRLVFDLTDLPGPRSASTSPPRPVRRQKPIGRPRCASSSNRQWSSAWIRARRREEVRCCTVVNTYFLQPSATATTEDVWPSTLPSRNTTASIRLQPGCQRLDTIHVASDRHRHAPAHDGLGVRRQGRVARRQLSPSKDEDRKFSRAIPPRPVGPSSGRFRSLLRRQDVPSDATSTRTARCTSNPTTDADKAGCSGRALRPRASRKMSDQALPRVAAYDLEPRLLRRCRASWPGYCATTSTPK